MVIYRRRLGTAVGAVVAHDEVATHGGNLVRVARLFAVRPLHVAPVLAGGDGIRIGVAIVAEREHRRRVVGGAEYRPTSFSLGEKLAADHIARSAIGPRLRHPAIPRAQDSGDGGGQLWERLHPDTPDPADCLRGTRLRIPPGLR